MSECVAPTKAMTDSSLNEREVTRKIQGLLSRVIAVPWNLCHVSGARVRPQKTVT